LGDVRPLIWKAALDALVAVPCSEALASLESAQTSAGNEKMPLDFSDRVREAIAQVREVLIKSANN
jgi:hypothetical protein